MAQQSDNREAMSRGVKPSQDLPTGSNTPEVFDKPSDKTGPSTSAGPAKGETSDPNFTAASRDRDDATQDAGVTRMDTGKDLGAIPPAAPKSGRAIRVADAMTSDIEVCEPDTQLYYVARMMEERDCGAIPVVQSTDSMKPIGIITDRDIVIRGVAKNQDALSLKASDVMSVGLLCVFPDMSIDECVQKMEQAEVRRAVVVDHTGRACGIIAQADIARGTNQCETGELVRDVSQPDPQQASRHYH